MSVIRRPAPDDADRPRLGAQGQVYVTAAAAERYAADRKLRIEEARRELTELMLDAKQSATAPQAYRARSRTSQVDVSARVVQEGRLMVVVSASARDFLR